MIKHTAPLFILLLLPLIFSCKSQLRKGNSFTEAISSSDTSLHLVNGIFLDKNSLLYNGEIRDYWNNGRLKSLRHIINGKEERLTTTFFESGNIESSRWYCKGEKDSVHTGWWENGNRKYEYHFSKGAYNGLFTEWYVTGNILQQVMYRDGKELYGRGWRSTGKLYMNFIMRDGRRYGLKNSNLCYGLAGEVVQ